MAMMPRDGKVDTANNRDLTEAATGQSTLPPGVEGSNVNYEVPKQQTDSLENYPIVMNPAMDRMAFDVSQYPNANRRLQGYMRGSRTRVIYYQQYGVSGDVRTNISDYPNERNVANTAFRRIRDFELTLPDAMQWQYDPDKGEGNAVGQALIYAGFQPLVGDFFVGPVGDNKLAIYRVSSVRSLSWRNDRVREIGYYFYNYADNGNLDFLEQGTVEKRIFDKTMYLGDIATLLTEESYADLQELRKLRDILAIYYYRKFFDRTYNTVIAPNGAYDPYVVKYMASACEFRVTGLRPSQLYPDTDLTYDYTLWRRLSENNNTQIDDLYPLYFNTNMIGYAKDIMLTPWVGSQLYVVTTPDSQEAKDGRTLGYYVMSEKFYNNDCENMSAFERIVWETIRTRQLTDTGNLLTNFLRPYMKLSAQDAFYQIPMYMLLIDIAIKSLSRRFPTDAAF